MKEKKEDVVQEMKKMLIGKEIEEQALKQRQIFLWGEVDDDSAQSVVQKILYFDGKEKADITLFINSPGGSITAGMAIYDAMRFARSDIRTVCMGQAASMGAVLLCAGTKGKRCAWNHARVLIHQPLISGSFVAPASDIEIHAEEMLRVRVELNKILSSHTGQPLEKIETDTDRDFFMSSHEAKEYGLIDEVQEGTDPK